MASNRLAIGQGLQLLLQGVTNPATSAPLYQAVTLGAFFNPEGYASWAEVAFMQAKSGPLGSGGNLVGWRIQDEVTYSIISGWDYEVDSTAAMTNLLTAQDILMPILHSHVVIPSPGNPAQGIASVFSVLEEMPERAVPVRIPNGHVYLLWHVYVLVKQQYSVIIQNP